MVLWALPTLQQIRPVIASIKLDLLTQHGACLLVASPLPLLDGPAPTFLLPFLGETALSCFDLFPSRALGMAYQDKALTLSAKGRGSPKSRAISRHGAKIFDLAFGLHFLQFAK